MIFFKNYRKSCKENIEEYQVVKSIKENHEEKVLNQSM